MYRVPQKLLAFVVLGFVFNTLCFAASWRLEKSITRGADGISMHYPLGMLYDSGRNKLYVVDSGNDRLLSFSDKWEPVKVFNAGGKLKLPIYMERDPEGNLLVVERSDNVIKKIELKTRRITAFPLFRKGRPVLIDRIAKYSKGYLVLDRISGNVLVYDFKFNYVRDIYPNARNFKGFFDIKVKGNTLWGMEVVSGRIFAIPLGGGSQKVIVPQKTFVEPVSFEVDSSGNIYVLDRYLKKVLVFSPTGAFKYSFCREGFREGELYYPWLLLFVKDKLLVLDEGNGRVDVWSK
ncbi:MAG: hypothetical protein GXO44_05465 [Deferribacteres bacterium]|nr:hypothetical protein [Deferribacteres bacterium]